MCSGAMGSLQAGEFSYGLGYTGTHSDNITRVPTNERSDWIHSYLARIAYQENTSDLVARVLAQAEYNDYQKNTYGDEAMYYVSSSAVWTISPRRFLWTVEDTARQALIDSTAVDTPANRTGVNIFVTGPDVFLRLSPVQTLALGARVGDVYTGRADADNKRFNGSAAWLYQSSLVSTYSLNYQALDVRYDNSTLNNDFRRQDFFARAEYRPIRSQYVLDFGTSDIDRDRGNDLRGTLARLSWTRQASAESSFGINVSREFSDTATDLLAASQVLMAPTTAPTAQTAPATFLTPDMLTADVYFAKRGEIFYTYRGSQTGVQFQASQRDLDFETTLLDRRETNGRLQIDYFSSPVTTISVFVENTRTKYLDLIRRDTDRNSGVRLNYFVTHTISLGLEGRHTERTSTVSTAAYVDNRVLLSIMYQTGPLFTPTFGR